jgi:hypothetical protein
MAASFPGLPEELMRIGTVTAIVGATMLAMPRPGCRCRCLMEAAGPGSWPGSNGDTMNASDVQAAGRPVLTQAGAAAGHRATQQGRRGGRQLTPALLGVG